MVKTVGKYELYRTLGEGSFGKVKYAFNKETNEAVAIKILDKEKIQKQNMGAQIKKEISIMKLINHHNVICVKDVFATTSKIFIVLELVEGGELFDKISSQGKLTEVQARFYFRQLTEGLDHCHSQGVCHRDLKPENLLLDAQGNIKISDFGLSALYVGDADAEGNARSELLHTTCGTPNYVAPEVLANHGYDGKKADVWSMGVILYVLLAGFLPFEENTMIALFLKIKNADFTYPSWFSRDVRTLLDKVLVSDPTKRLTLNELKHHQWLVEGAACPDAPGSVGHDDSHSNATEAVEASRKEVAAAHAKNPLPSHNRTPPASQPASPGKPASSDVVPKIDHINGSKTETVKTSIQTASSTSQSSPVHSAGNDRQSSSPSQSPRLAESDKPAMNTVLDGKAHTAHSAPSPSHSGKAAAAAAVHSPSVTAPTSTSTAAPEHTAAKSDMGGKHKGKEKDGSAIKPATQACCTIA